jgi:hypothetical protein
MKNKLFSAVAKTLVRAQQHIFLILNLAVMSNGNDKNSVQDGKKLTDEQLGGLTRRFTEIIKRIQKKILNFKDVMDILQLIIEGKTFEYLGVIRGTHRIIASDGVVDSSAKPKLPDEEDLEHVINFHNEDGVLTLQKHKEGLLVNNKLVKLFRDDRQKDGELIGAYLQVALEDKKVLNATVLSYLLSNPQYIPDEWKSDTSSIYFWGTTYREKSSGRWHVRCIFWNPVRTKWDWETKEVADKFDGDDFSAILTE